MNCGNGELIRTLVFLEGVRCMEWEDSTLSKRTRINKYVKPLTQAFD